MTISSTHCAFLRVGIWLALSLLCVTGGAYKRKPAAPDSATAATSTTASTGEVFFEGGKTEWKIYLPARSHPTEVFAAEELKSALKKISGADFPVVNSDTPPTTRAIVIGTLTAPAVKVRAGELQLAEGKVEQAAVRVVEGQLYLAGNQPRGALYAVYSFLQRELGVRWLWPGPEGEFMPARASWRLPTVKFQYQPAFAYRGMHMVGDWRDHLLFREWMARNFINLHRHAAPEADQRRGIHVMYSSHNADLPKRLFAQHPEYFAEIRGKRYASSICMSHPEVDKLVATDLAEYLRKHPSLEIISVFPADSQDYCRCARCATKDVSTAWFEFYNRLTETMKAEFPKLKFATIAYQGYRDVPKCKVLNSEFIEYATHSRCNIHRYGEPGCKHNEDTMRAFQEWKATGLPVGNYSYEFDVCFKNVRFWPFVSMIEDAVKTGRKLGHVAMVPEVPLHPKTGPDTSAHHVQSRLSIYLYARLLWEPDKSANEILRDWCETVFGKAAAPMLNYYQGMDRAWSAMPTHASILGDALRLAPMLLAGRQVELANADFAAAEKLLAGIEDAASRQRATDALQRERLLFKQWQDLVQLRDTSTTRIGLPQLASAGDFTQTASLPQTFGAAKTGTTRVTLAWTKEALLAKWLCQDPNLKNLKAAASQHDGKVTDDDSVELELSSGLSGETWHFAANSLGTRQDFRISSVGMREADWNPDWQAKAAKLPTAWEVEMTIPFAALKVTPNTNDTWQARLHRHNGGRTDVAAAVFPAEQSAALTFSAASQSRALLWWSGLPDKDSGGDAKLVQDFEKLGWQANIASTPEKLLAAHPKCEAFWFRHPNGASKVPATYWRTHLIPAVRNGAVAVFCSYLPVPLDQYFGDPAMKTKIVTCGQIPLAGRVTKFIGPGDWSTKPNDVLNNLKGGYAPAYGFVPEQPAGWTVLATGSGEKGPYPYLLVRRYGKGLLVLAGEALPAPSSKMLDNFVLMAKSEK